MKTMKSWKTHLLKLRNDHNSNNAIIQKRYFKLKSGVWGVNTDLDEQKLYDEYHRVCNVTMAVPILDPMYPGIKLTQSDMIRKNTNQAKVKNVESKFQDDVLKYSVEEVISMLEKKFPNSIFGWDPTFGTKYLDQLINGVPITNADSHIRPDGGFVYVMIGSKKHYILVSEQKRQGTNDKRLAEGLSVQGVGNAFERLANYLRACDIIFKDEKIYPFVAWLQGCDFREDSSIPARVRMLFLYQKENAVHLWRKNLGEFLWSGGSYFMRGHELDEPSGSSDWTPEEMIPIMYEVAEGATKYYIKKYGE